MKNPWLKLAVGVAVYCAGIVFIEEAVRSLFGMDEEPQPFLRPLHPDELARELGRELVRQKELDRDKGR